LYAGQIVEYAPTELMGRSPAHPYTQGLLGSFPDMRGERRELHGIPGNPPDLRADFAGCPFAPRCPAAFEPCHTTPPPLLPVPGEGDWLAACHLVSEPQGAALSGPVSEPQGAALSGLRSEERATREDSA
jgi:peptide/nickel transport system ATP-binding protein